MTNREFFEAVQNGTINADVQAHATAEIEKMNARNEKRATTPSKTAIANEPIKLKIIEFLNDVIGEIPTASPITSARASVLCNQWSEDDQIVGED